MVFSLNFKIKLIRRSGLHAACWCSELYGWAVWMDAFKSPKLHHFFHGSKSSNGCGDNYHQIGHDEKRIDVVPLFGTRSSTCHWITAIVCCQLSSPILSKCFRCVALSSQGSKRVWPPAISTSKLWRALGELKLDGTLRGAIAVKASGPGCNAMGAGQPTKRVLTRRWVWLEPNDVILNEGWVTPADLSCSKENSRRTAGHSNGRTHALLQRIAQISIQFQSIYEYSQHMCIIYQYSCIINYSSLSMSVISKYESFKCYFAGWRPATSCYIMAIIQLLVGMFPI